MSSASALDLRDQLIRCYEKTDNGRDGFVRPVWRYTASWWGRIDETVSQTRVIQGAQTVKEDARAVFADEATIPVNGVILDPDGVLWWVRGQSLARLTRSISVTLDRVSSDQYKQFVTAEGESILDGVHLVDPAS